MVKPTANGVKHPVSTGKRVPENVFDGPYSIKEGDLLCAFEVPAQSAMITYRNTSNISKNDDSVTPIMNNGPLVTAVSRPEDKHLKEMLEQIKKESRGKTGYKQQRNNREIALSLGGNLEFSSDDDSD